MSMFEFDAQNQRDFDRITEVLTQCLLTISSDSALKPTVAQLSRLSGVHRHTIEKRGWPATRLKDIKENRRLEELRKAVKVESRSDPISVLTERLEKSRLEVLYWFSKATEYEDLSVSLDNRLRIMIDARNHAEENLQAQKKMVKMVEERCSKLQSVVEMYESMNLGEKN
ncbi:hypothetical protein [Stutzerimonas stutzeri]|uniref:hypothetical protein n=1 Tax=Stutzerimonas stutzeri TaxID=316 RepID=UPI0015E28828|nr:hypothetical protein [Stutzerimonas stutzeri]MBA1278839.1 hypothetical protein [Stutzerimonas stutzeri]